MIEPNRNDPDLLDEVVVSCTIIRQTRRLKKQYKDVAEYQRDLFADPEEAAGYLLNSVRDYNHPNWRPLMVEAMRNVLRAWGPRLVP